MRRESERGSALAYALIVLVLVAAASFTALGYGVSATKVSSNQVARAQLRGLAESGLALATHDLWDKYIVSNGGAAGNAKSYCLYVQGQIPGFSALSATPLGTPTTLVTVTNQSLGTATSAANRANLTVTAAIGYTVPSGVPSINTANAVYLQLVSTASTTDGKTKVTLTGNYKVGAAQWPGLRFAMLTNNVSCSFCHATFDNAARVFNTDPTKYGTFPRARLACLQSTGIFTNGGFNDAVSIYGTLYTNSGIFSSSNGTAIAAGSGAGQLSNSSSPNVRFGQIDASGNIVQNAGGSLPGTVAPTNEMANASPAANKNLYIGYPLSGSGPDATSQTGGPVPSSFPAIIPDTAAAGYSAANGRGGGNGVVDDSEWATTVSGASGTLTATNVVAVPFASTTTATSLPTAGTTTTFNSDGSSGNVSTANQNFILNGTVANPIVLNGTVAFPGDVVIAGVVQGTGSIVARGNVYIASDIKYNDGKSGSNRTFGVQPNATTAGYFGTLSSAGSGGQNAVAIAAGGNVLIGQWMTMNNGNFYSPAVYSSPSNNSNYSQSQLTFAEAAIYNRNEWAKTQYALPTNDVGAAGVAGAAPGTTTWALNPSYVPGYTPRFYTQDDGKVYVAANLYSGQGATSNDTGFKWNAATGAWTTNTVTNTSEIPAGLTTNVLSTSYLNGTYALDSGTSTVGPPPVAPASTTNLPATVSVAPGGNPNTGGSWISEANLKTLIDNAIAARTNNTPLEVDGLIYTNNAIFCIAKTTDTTGGKLTVNGSLLAADTGILASSGFTVNYDVNTAPYINVQDPTHVQWMTGTVTEK